MYRYRGGAANHTLRISPCGLRRNEGIGWMRLGARIGSRSVRRAEARSAEECPQECGHGRLEARSTGEVGPFGIGVSGFLLFEIGAANGFDWQFSAEGFEAVELFDGAAVLTCGLGLMAQQEGKTARLAARRWDGGIRAVPSALRNSTGRGLRLSPWRAKR